MTSPSSFEIASPSSWSLFLPPIHVASLLVRLSLIGKTCLPCRRAQAPSDSDQEHNLNFVTSKGNIVVVFRLKEKNIFKKRTSSRVNSDWSSKFLWSPGQVHHGGGEFCPLVLQVWVWWRGLRRRRITRIVMIMVIGIGFLEIASCFYHSNLTHLLPPSCRNCRWRSSSRQGKRRSEEHDDDHGGNLEGGDDGRVNDSENIWNILETFPNLEAREALTEAMERLVLDLKRFLVCVLFLSRIFFIFLENILENSFLIVFKISF